MANKSTKYKSKVDYEKFKTVIIVLLVLIICCMGFGLFWQNKKLQESNDATTTEQEVQAEVVEEIEEAEGAEE